MNEAEEATIVSRVSLVCDSFADLENVLEGCRLLSLRDVTVTPVPVAAFEHLPSRWRYFVDATDVTARDALAKTASLQSTRSAAS